MQYLCTLHMNPIAALVSDDEAEIIKKILAQYEKNITEYFIEQDKKLLKTIDGLGVKTYKALAIFALIRGLLRSIYEKRISNKYMLDTLHKNLRNFRFPENEAESIEKAAFYYIKNITARNQKEYRKVLSELYETGLHEDEAEDFADGVKEFVFFSPAHLISRGFLNRKL